MPERNQRSSSSVVHQAITSASKMKRATKQPSFFERLCQRCSSSSRAKRRLKLLEKGTERIDNQLDIVSFLRKQLLLSTLMHTIWRRPAERYLARHQYQTFVLDPDHDQTPPDSEASSDDSSSAVKQKIKNYHYTVTT